MIYNASNAHGASVFDVDTVSKLASVMQIDTERGEVECFHQPLRINYRGEVDTFKIRFRSIYAISGGSKKPCLFHCYGRV